MRKRRFAKTISIFIACLVFLQTVSLQSVFAEPAASDNTVAQNSASQTADRQATTTAAEETQEEEYSIISKSFVQISYDEYMSRYGNKPMPDKEIIINAAQYTKAEDMELEVLSNFEGSKTDSLKTGDEGYVEWEVEVEEEGLYNIAVKYFPIKGKNSSIERELYIDGELPFEAARSITFQRVWTNGKAIISDDSGNEYRPEQIEAPTWLEVGVSGTVGYHDEPFKFYFSKGKHTIRLTSVKEPMVIEYLKLYQEEEIPTYEEVKKEYEKKGYKIVSKDVEMIKVQGEDAVLKSDQTLYPVDDHTSPATEPNSVTKTLLNVGGGNNWKSLKQWMTWTVEVEEDGLYQIAFRAKQNFKSGIFASRALYIDGKIPFQEAARIRFPYNAGWQMISAGDGNEPYLFYLTKGQHEIKMEVVLGDLSEVLRSVESTVRNLNSGYNKIIMITGGVPDSLRDYNLDEQVPHVIEMFAEEAKNLRNASELLAKLTGGKGEEAATMEKTAIQLEGFVYDVETIPERLDNFSSNISALAAWIQSATEQPLTIDYIVIASPEQKLPRADAPWYSKFVFEIKRFLMSFVSDYDIISSADDDGENHQAVTLWIGTGRDQAQVLKSLIDNTFTPQTGIRVNLRLVDMGILLRAVASNQGPDVAIYQAQSTPVDYALRGALQDLTVFEDLPEVLERFAPSAREPFMIGDSLYALPEQQTFDMMFYRKDILADLGLEIPQTWEDLYAIIPILQKNNLDVGLNTPMDTATGRTINSVYLSILYQNGGTIYNEDKSRAVLDSPVAIESFIKWTELYTKYKLPLKFDTLTRFRMGTMPIVISPYTLYNSLAVAAPEIRGLWGMAPVPGTLKEDGTIDRSVSGTTTGAVMFKNAKDKEASWEFLKWWTSEDTQLKYGQEMEGLQGASARWPTANLAAMDKLPWPTADAKSIQEQWKYVKAVPEVPGGYYTGRYMDNAVRSVINSGVDARETLLDAVETMNDEIIQKRKEFGME